MQAILIDGKNLAFRFAWANRNLTDDDGHPTGATLGMLRVLLGLKEKYPGARLVVAWDGQRTPDNWRIELFPGYKKRTGEVPSLVATVMAQLEDMHEALDLVGIPQMEADDVEADDLIGILAAVLKKKGHQPIIYSSDYDYAQLLRYGICIIRKGTDNDPYRLEPLEHFTERYGCSLREIHYVRALQGDTSDKIPSPGRGLAQKAPEIIAAGIRPEDRSTLTRALERQYPVLCSNWDAFVRNSKIMKIPLSWKGLEYSGKQSMMVRTIAAALKRLENPTPSSGVSLSKFLMDKQFISLLKERKRLLRLNDI